MSVPKYHALAGEISRISDMPCGSFTKEPIVVMDGSYFKDCIYSEVSWLKTPGRCEGLVKHTSDELHVFLGHDHDDIENLNAEILFQIENDILTLTKTCCVFVPGGTAHGNFEIKSLKEPVFHYVCHLDADTYEETPAEPTAAPGAFAGYVVEKYEPVDGKMPTESEIDLTPLLWIDAPKLKGAPYMEAAWFNTVNYTGPTEHRHVFDEFVAFFGSDPENPDVLGGEVGMNVGGEVFYFTKSCLIFIPRGVVHAPIYVPKLERPILHFSGGNGGSYVRLNTDS